MAVSDHFSIRPGLFYPKGAFLTMIDSSRERDERYIRDFSPVRSERDRKSCFPAHNKIDEIKNYLVRFNNKKKDEKHVKKSACR